MDLTYSPEQRLLGDSAIRFVTDRYSLEQRRLTMRSERGCSEDVWRAFAELGWLGLNVPEEFGGYGAGAVETNLIMEAFGRGLVVEPYVPVAVMAASLITAIGSSQQRQDLLPAIASGKRRIALANAEPHSRFSAHTVSTRAIRQEDNWRLAGCKSVVRGGPAADTLLVSARIAGDVHDRDGIGIFLVPLGARGLRMQNYESIDRVLASNLELEDVVLPTDALLGGNEDALMNLEQVVDRAIVAMTSQAVGCMQALLEATVAHVNSRVQFGKPLSSNQVVRHRLVDIAIGIEEARACALNAALLLDADPVVRTKAVSGAKVKAGRAGRFAAEQAVQLHGAMGVTEELVVGEYFKTIMCIETLFGNADYHIQRHASASQLMAV